MAKRKVSRNTQGSGSIRQRLDGRWEGRYTVGVNPATGKQDQRSVYGATEAEVAKKLRKIVQEIDDDAFIEPSKLTVGKWMDIWVSDFLGHVKEGTRIDYQSHIKNHIKPAFGAVKLNALTAVHIQKLYNEMIANQLSGKTVKNLHAVIHSALKQALRLGYVRTNVSDACTLPRAEKVPIKPLGLPDVKLFMQAIKGTEYENLYIVALFTGMREAELSGLQWQCVDFQCGAITIDKQLMRPRGKEGAYRFASVKNDKVRVVHPAPLVMDALKTQRKAQLEQRLQIGSAWNDGGYPDLVFTTPTGEHLSFNTILRRFQVALKKAGLENRRFHDLRHSYGVTALQAGDSIKDVSENLGHATAGFTADVYLHVTPTMKDASAKRMQNLIENKL